MGVLGVGGDVTTYIIRTITGMEPLDFAGYRVKVLAWIPPKDKDWPSKAQAATVEFLDGPRKGQTEEVWESDLEEMEQD